MAGTFTFDPPGVPPGRAAYQVFAALYVAGQSPPWAVLPNVRPLDCHWQEGCRPPVARFRYQAGDPYQDLQSPIRFEQVFPLTATGPGVIQNDDRLGIFRVGPSGNPDLLFDGFAQAPQLDLDPGTELVSFAAVGTPVREWDDPLPGAFVRSSSDPSNGSGVADAPTDLPARFNPGGHPQTNTSGGVPNASPDQADATIKNPIANGPTDPPDIPCPVFLGPYPPENQIVGSDLRFWTLPMAVSYCCCVGNPDMTYVQFDPNGPQPSGTSGSWYDLLFAPVPTNPGGAIDLSKPPAGGGYTRKDIVIDDFDVTGMAWPEAVERLIAPHGFAMTWRLSTDDDLNPTWQLALYRQDEPNTYLKDLQLQPAENPLDPGQSNTSGLRLARDSHAIMNRVAVDSKLVLVEASFILAPGFGVNSSDANDVANFDRDSPSFTGANRDKYRLYVLDESGEGHWNFKTQANDNTPSSLKNAIVTPAVYGSNPLPNAKPANAQDYAAKYGHAIRRRKPHSPLISLDSNNEPLKADLYVSFDYGRSSPGTWYDPAQKPPIEPTPGLWNGEDGTWDRVNPGTWELLDDQIGVRITAQQPDELNVGIRDGMDFATYAGPWAANGWPAAGILSRSGGIAQLVTWTASPLPAPANGVMAWDVPVFRLTCLVEADVDIGVAVSQQTSSPTRFRVTRTYDGKNRFKKSIVSFASAYNPKDEDTVVEDDTDDATALATGMVRAHQFATFAGVANIPRLTLAYRIRDKIRKVAGREASLQSNAGTEGATSNVYPNVVGISWNFDGEQSTTLTLSDRRAGGTMIRHAGPTPPRRRGIFGMLDGRRILDKRAGVIGRAGPEHAGLGRHPADVSGFKDLGKHPADISGFEDLGKHPEDLSGYKDLGKRHPTDLEPFKDLGKRRKTAKLPDGSVVWAE